MFSDGPGESSVGRSWAPKLVIVNGQLPMP